MRILNSFKYRIIQLYFRLTLYNQFDFFGLNSQINSPLSIGKPENIYIGNNVSIQYKAWLCASSQTGEQKASLMIKDGCRLGNFNHIYATKSIIVEKNVLTADKVYISDNQHSYDNITIPVWQQKIKQLNEVVIGEGSWLGENVCVIGASIGRQCVIGANSTVTKDIPDFCVAVGSPARIIKRYSPENKIWGKTNPDGSFVNQALKT